jgi:surfeit locus 1 family protein
MMLLVGIMPILTFSLGTWQVSRLKWKIALIDELEEKLQQSPLQLPPHINLDVIPEFVFRKVIITGQWDHARTMFLKPRVNDGVHGVHVVTPLVRDNGTTVLVDRGFVSNEVASSQSFGKPSGQVTVLGMIRTSQTRNAFTPDNEPTQNNWYWTDVNAMADHAGGQAAQVQPVFIEQIFEGDAGEAQLHLHNGMPLGRPPTVDIRNAHLSYIITWYVFGIEIRSISFYLFPLGTLYRLSPLSCLLVWSEIGDVSLVKGCRGKRSFFVPILLYQTTEYSPLFLFDARISWHILGAHH